MRNYVYRQKTEGAKRERVAGRSVRLLGIVHRWLMVVGDVDINVVDSDL